MHTLTSIIHDNFFFFSSRRRHTRFDCDWSSDVCSSDLNIERAVKKGTGELEGVTYEEVTYEAYGPGGAALLIEATTDNANRTVAEIRNAFQRHGGNLGATNSVAWMFDRKAQIDRKSTRLNSSHSQISYAVFCLKK